MDNKQRFWYLDEILTQGIAASVSYDAVHRYVGNPETRQTLLVWSNISAFLSHAGVISKILFPPRRDSQGRGTELIELMQLENLETLQRRAARNNIEHIDERIDNWAANETNSLISMVIPDREGYEYLCTPEKSIRRVLIQDEFTYISENQDRLREEMPLTQLKTEIDYVVENANAAIHRDPPYHFVLAQLLENDVR